MKELTIPRHTKCATQDTNHWQLCLFNTQYGTIMFIEHTLNQSCYLRPDTLVPASHMYWYATSRATGELVSRTNLLAARVLCQIVFCLIVFSVQCSSSAAHCWKLVISSCIMSVESWYESSLTLSSSAMALSKACACAGQQKGPGR